MTHDYEKSLKELDRLIAAQGQLAEEFAKRGLFCGYTVIELPDIEKSAFHDLLKGFEDYAKLRGYGVRVSVDSSLPNKFAFKFTFDSDSKFVTPTKAHGDLNEYFMRVQSKDDFAALAKNMPGHQHQVLLAAITLRIGLLDLTYDLEKNRIPWQKWDEKFFEQFCLQFTANNSVEVRLVQSTGTTA